ncbi:MAG: site-specific integrase [Streptomyces sp.]|uniref:tyrosine-type recombinase/integrase n=1 Tax=Streptomyces sp. TaxID=1931 RepID=UPI0025D8E8A5|nr:site-specific integrase [Streptomyces sp.]MBW8800177.1 site-specific integrase [Streptomyces sp.]
MVTAPAPGSDASDAEVTAFLWSMIREDFLAEAGWNAERRVMTPVGHPTMGGRRCPVPNCQSPVRGKKLCSTCYSRHRTSGMPLEEFVRVPRISRHLHLGTENCRVSGCERPWINSGNEPVCRAHRWQMIKHGGTLEEFLADPSVKGLAGLGDCSVLACNRQAVNERGTRLCYPHSKQHAALRREPGFDEEEWLRTEPSGSFGIEISFRGLPELVVAQLLFGLQHRCHRGARTEAGNFRALIDKTIRPSLARRLEDVPDPVANSNALILLNRTRIYAIRAVKTPEGEYAKDEWDLVAFGHRGTLVFTLIHQPWLRESAKRWARDYLSKVRSKSTASHAQQHLHGLAKVSDTLRARPDRGMDKSELSRADIENFLNRMAFLEANGRFTTNTRATYVRMARNVLKQCRVMGLTRPEGPMAGLPDDFVITRLDVPKAPGPSEEGQDLPPEVMRQLCSHLDSFEAMTCLEIRLSVELLMDTGRRPEEICRLELNCLTRDSQGKPVLLYNNWKEQRIGRQLPIHEPTAQLIIEQQKRVRERFPDRSPSALVLLPAQNLNLRGDRSVDANHLSAMHREWVEKLPDFVLDDGTVFDKEKIFPYAYRHSFAQRHADAGVPVDVLAELMDHDSLESTRSYYRVKEVRLREAVERVTQMQFDRHGTRIWGAVTTVLDAERTRRAIGAVVVPFGTCSEPTNVAAGGGACPLRFRCVGCDHFSTDVSYLPDLRTYLDDLLRQREKLRSMAGADDWARAEAMPSDAEITRIRRLIQRVTEDVATLTEAERAEIQRAAQVVRQMRQNFLGMPRIRQPLPDLRPERPA